VRLLSPSDVTYIHHSYERLPWSFMFPSSTEHAMRLALDEAMEFDVKRTYIVKQKWKAEALGGGGATIPYGRDKDYKIRYLKS